MGVQAAVFFGAFSGALLLQGLLGPRGRTLGRPARRATSLAAGKASILAIALVGMALAQNTLQLIAAWLVPGIGMSLALYDIAFAGLVGWFGWRARKSITGVTLIAGFASTIAWPATAWLEAQFGWRTAALVWAAANSA